VTIAASRFGRTLVLTIDRPAERNALNRDVVRGLGRFCREAATDDTVRAIVLTGAGEKAFCAGADLKERRGMSLDDIRDFLAMYRTELRFLDSSPKPTICVLNGVAFGGGLEVALCCDLRIAAPHAEIGLTEVSLGIIPGAGGTQRLTRLVGEAKAKELLLLSTRLPAEEALRLGLVHRVDPAPMALALSWAERMGEGAPIAMAAALEAVDAACDLPLEAGLAAELRAYEKTLVSEDRVEALDAFLAKRKPDFKGR
jgi:methylglutaconyl-CoA hydratase